MPDYTYTLTFLDYQNGKTTRSWKGTFATVALADAAAASALAAAQAISGARVIKTQLTEVAQISGAAPANVSVFEIAQLSIELSGGADKLGSSFVPAAIDAIYSGNSVLIANALVLDWIAIAGTTAGDGWTVSDGDTIDSIKAGERTFVKSGSTNLPS